MVTNDDIARMKVELQRGARYQVMENGTGYQVYDTHAQCWVGPRYNKRVQAAKHVQRMRNG